MAKAGYEVKMAKSRQKLRFAFISKGMQDITKIIAYDYVGRYDGKKIFNLGFGDFDPVTLAINDNVNTANGDAYDVLNTVLNTVPLFFNEYPQDTLMIRGSDSGVEFIKQCKPKCKKNCKNVECKNQHRRINVYTRYVNNNYEELKNGYAFLGGNGNSVETFEKDKRYDTVFISKNINFAI